MAFWVSFCWARMPRNVFNLPLRTSVFTAFTLTLKALDRRLDLRLGRLRCHLEDDPFASETSVDFGDDR